MTGNAMGDVEIMTCVHYPASTASTEMHRHAMWPCFRLTWSACMVQQSIQTAALHTPCGSCLQDIVRASTKDADLALAVRRIGHMVVPPEGLFAPGILGKVMLFRLRRSFGRLFQQRNSPPEPSYVE